MINRMNSSNERDKESELEGLQGPLRVVSSLYKLTVNTLNVYQVLTWCQLEGWDEHTPVTNADLRGSTGRSTQRSLITHMGKRTDLWMCVTESLRRTPETNTTFSINYTPIHFFGLFRAAPEAYGHSQARGLTGAAAAGLHHSHSNTGSEPRLQSTPQLTATPDF